MSAPNAPSDPGGRKGAAAEPESGDSGISKLEAHFRGLDDNSLRRVAHAVELARATAKSEPTDDQILEALRPRLKEIRPYRVRTFQRAVCTVLEPFLINGPQPEEKRKGAIPRAVLQPWWTLVTRNAPEMAALSAAYGQAIRADKAEQAAEITGKGCDLAASVTLSLLSQSENVGGRRGAVIAIVGSDRVFPDLIELAELMRRHAQLGPAFERVRAAAPTVVDGRIADFALPSVLAARTAYTTIHAAEPQMLEYFIIGLLNILVQPWQALRLVRVLSTDMSKAGEGFLDFIPTRLFSDLTRTLTEIGRSVGTEGGMSRRVWLMTCARLLNDAGSMIKGLAEEAQQPESPPEWKRVLADARQKVLAAVDGFAGSAVEGMLVVLPAREVREKDNEVRFEPDMTRRPSEEMIATAMAASQLFITARKLAEQEGNERAFRSKEADLIHRLSIAVNFRVEFLRARGRNPAALAQLDAVHTLLGALPRTEAVLDLLYKTERMVERFKS